MVLVTAISSRAVNASAEMTPLSSKMVAKMISISAFVCSSQAIKCASPGRQPNSRPASATPRRLPATEATSSTPATANTAVPPTSHCVRRPVDKKNTGIMNRSTALRTRSKCPSSNHWRSMMTPARKAPTMKCRPLASEPSAHSSSHIRPKAQRSGSAAARRPLRTNGATAANASRKPIWWIRRWPSTRISASTIQMAMSSRLA